MSLAILLLNAELSTAGGVIALQVIEVKEEQLPNAKRPILVTPAGSMIELNEEQPKNVLYSIFVTPSGILIEVKV